MPSQHVQGQTHILTLRFKTSFYDLLRNLYTLLIVLMLIYNFRAQQLFFLNNIDRSLFVMTELCVLCDKNLKFSLQVITYLKSHLHKYCIDT